MPSPPELSQRKPWLGCVKLSGAELDSPPRLLRIPRFSSTVRFFREKSTREGARYSSAMIPTQPFGSTGFVSTRLLFGAAALASMKPDRVERTLELIERHGINHIDVAASYGEAESKLAPWLVSNRDRVFLATKTGDRTA